MKNLLTTLTLLLALSTFTRAQQQQEILQLSLTETLEFALENNVNSKNARLEVLISKARVKEETSKGLPQINGSFNINYNPEIPVVFLPNEPPFGDPDLPSDVIPARFGVSYQSGLGVTVSQMIFDGSFFLGLKAANTYTELTQFDQIKAENDVIENVKKAYFGVLVNDRRIELSESNLRRLDSLLAETKALNEAGFSEKLDVSRISVQRNNTLSELKRAETAYDISKQLLKIQMGLPSQYDVEILESLADLNPEEELEEILLMEGIRRVELDQLSKQFELTSLDLKNNHVQYMPAITFNANYQRSGAGNSFGTTFESVNWFSSSLLGVTMTIPIFDGFRKSALIQKNRVQLRQIENQQIFLEQNIDLEIFQARETLSNDLDILRVQQENMILAQEVFDITKIKYNEGVGTNLEVVEADAALVTAQINYLSSLYDGLIAKVDLEKALGILKSNLNF